MTLTTEQTWSRCTYLSYVLPSSRLFWLRVSFSREGTRATGGGGTHSLHALAVQPLTTRPCGSEALFPQERLRCRYSVRFFLFRSRLRKLFRGFSYCSIFMLPTATLSPGQATSLSCSPVSLCYVNTFFVWTGVPVMRKPLYRKPSVIYGSLMKKGERAGVGLTFCSYPLDH